MDGKALWATFGVLVVSIAVVVSVVLAWGCACCKKKKAPKYVYQSFPPRYSPKTGEPPVAGMPTVPSVDPSYKTWTTSSLRGKEKSAVDGTQKVHIGQEPVTVFSDSPKRAGPGLISDRSMSSKGSTKSTKEQQTSKRREPVNASKQKAVEALKQYMERKAAEKTDSERQRDEELLQRQRERDRLWRQRRREKHGVRVQFPLAAGPASAPTQAEPRVVDRPVSSIAKRKWEPAKLAQPTGHGGDATGAFYIPTDASLTTPLYIPPSTRELSPSGSGSTESPDDHPLETMGLKQNGNGERNRSTIDHPAEQPTLPPFVTKSMTKSQNQPPNRSRML